MVFCKILLCLFVVTKNLWITHGLNVENVYGGRVAEQSHFRYHVTIMGRTTYVNNSEIICGGGLIREDLVLSIAFCFLNTDGSLKPFRFYIVAGTNDISSLSGIRLDINKIYVPQPNENSDIADVSVSSLRGRLEFGLFSDYSKLNLPMGPNYFDYVGTYLAGVECLRTTNNDNLLKFLHAEILEDSVCQYLAPEYFDDLDAIGWKLAKLANQTSGLCDTDSGSPLVFGTTVVGLVIKPYPEAIPFGKLIIYTDVYNLVDFIELAMEEHPDPLQDVPEMYVLDYL